jgi:hypothetical protein
MIYLPTLDQLVGKEVILTDANVGGAGNDGASVRAGGAAFRISSQGIDRETFRYLLENCHMVTEPPECQGLQLLVTLSGEKSPSGPSHPDQCQKSAALKALHGAPDQPTAMTASGHDSDEPTTAGYVRSLG